MFFTRIFKRSGMVLKEESIKEMPELELKKTVEMNNQIKTSLKIGVFESGVYRKIDDPSHFFNDLAPKNVTEADLYTRIDEKGRRY